MKRLILATLLLASPALAQQAKPDPIMQALGQMLAESQTREAQANIRAFTAEARATETAAELAKLKAADMARDEAAAKVGAK